MASNPIPDTCAWTARTLRPVIVAYVALVWVAFIALAWFVFHSGDAVGALAAGGLGSLVMLVPSLLARQEYRLTAAGVEKRSARGRKEFAPVFRWDELERLQPTGTGWKYAKILDDPRPVARFWKRHVSDAYGGEIHVEPGDRRRVGAALARGRGAA